MVKARKQAEKILQKKANKIKQRIESNEKAPTEKKEKKSRGALQREKKRARKEAGEEDTALKTEADTKKKMKSIDATNAAGTKEKTSKPVRPQKKRKNDSDENKLEDMIRSYKQAFTGGVGTKSTPPTDKATETNVKSRESVAKRRWFEQ